MRRREFITLLGGATTWPLAVHAQAERMRRIGVLMAYPEADLEAKALISEFTNSLAVLGWTEGGNLRMDVRWAGSNLESMRKFAKVRRAFVAHRFVMHPR
jgi:putative tryptophan/tyrosine transport system substrate-binding protein